MKVRCARYSLAVFVLLVLHGSSLCPPHVAYAADSETKPVEIVAEVNGEQITRHELDNAVRRFLKHLDQEIKGAERHEVQLSVLRTIINRKLLLQTAAQKKFVISPEEVERLYEHFIASLPAGTSLQDVLSEEGITEEELRRGFREDLLIARYTIELEAALQPPTENTLREFLANNFELFEQPRERRIRQLYLSHSTSHEKLVTDQNTPRSGGRSPEQILSQLSPDGANFIELIRRYSEGPKKEDGDLGYVTESQLPPELAGPVFSQPVGSLTPPIRSGNGIYVFRIEEERNRRVPKFETIRSEVEAVYRRKEGDRRIREHINELRQRGKVVEYIS